MKRFWDKVDISGDCWEWKATTITGGYGHFGLNGELVLAHRFSYSLVYGEIPEGMCICHHCDNPGCVRPSHLFMGTRSDNARDMVAKGRDRQPDSRGERQGASKLVENDVREIRRLYVTGRVTQALLSKMWRVSKQHVHDIVHRKKWKHI